MVACGFAANCRCLYVDCIGKKGGFSFIIIWYSRLVSLDGVYQPTVLSTKSDKRLAEEVNTYVQDGVMYSYTTRLIRFYCTNYYLNDRMRNFTPGLSGTGYVMLSERTKEDFLKEYSDKYQLEEIYLTPYRSCDLRDKVLIYKFSEK